MAEYYRLPIATSKIAICIFQDFTLLQVPGRHSVNAWKEFFSKKTQPSKPFWWVPVSLFTSLLFEVKSWGRGDLVLALFLLERLMGSPARACCGGSPVSPFSQAGINSHWGAEISLYSYKYLKVFRAGGEIWTQGQTIKCMGDVALKRSASKKSRIQALKGCADARKVLQTRVVIRICSQG